MACVFCKSTQPFKFINGKYLRLLRNLSSEEIFVQIENAIKLFPKPVGSKGYVFSFMGMGEPFANIDSVKKCLVKIGKFYSGSRVTISTIGLDLNGILKLGKEIKSGLYKIPIKLHISLHASNNKIRFNLMPKASSILKTIKTAEKFAQITNTKVKLNYVLIKNINDSTKDIDRLFKLLLNRKNLIIKISDLNSDIKNKCVNKNDANDFYLKLKEKGLNVCRFSSYGRDIGGGCGQFIKRNKI